MILTPTSLCHVSARYDAALVGAVRLFSVAIAALLMDKAGRKALLYASSMLMFLSTLTLSMNAYPSHCPPGPTPTNATLILNYNSIDVTENTGAGVLPLICTMVFIFGEHW